MYIEATPLGQLSANFYVIADEEAGVMAVVDPGARFDLIENILSKRKERLAYILLTHAHTDHIGALDDMAGRYNAKIVIHADDESALNNSRLNLCSMLGLTSPISKADITAKDGEIIAFGSTGIKVIHTPGHTRGSSCYLIGNNLFSGDTIFDCSIGRTDFPGGSYTDIRSSIHNKIFTLPPETIIYPGHGNSTTVKNEYTNNPFV